MSHFIPEDIEAIGSASLGEGISLGALARLLAGRSIA